LRLSRRDFLNAILAAMGALSARTLGIPLSIADPPEHRARIASFVGEALEYQLDCLMLPKIATGRLEFKKIHEKAMFLATLRTKVEGVLGLLTFQRSDIFASVMAWSEDRGRFLPQWYAEQVSRRTSWKRKVLVFSQEKERYTEHKIYPDHCHLKRKRTRGRILDDPLSAFYNWRIGAFGALGPGQSQRIDNLAKNDPFVLQLTTASMEEARIRKAESLDSDQWTYFMRAQLGQEVLEVIRGEVEGWLSEDWVPLYAKGTKVRWIGELSGHLVRKRQLSEPEQDTCPSPPLKKEIWTI
jgi:hypothetical protein